MVQKKIRLQHSVTAAGPSRILTGVPFLSAAQACDNRSPAHAKRPYIAKPSPGAQMPLAAKTESCQNSITAKPCFQWGGNRRTRASSRIIPHPPDIFVNTAGPVLVDVPMNDHVGPIPNFVSRAVVGPDNRTHLSALIQGVSLRWTIVLLWVSLAADSRPF